MTPEALTALQASIKHWEDVVDDVERNIDPVLGPLNCPLCKMFLKRRFEEKMICAGCPVKESTGKPYCHGTPYQDFIDSQTDESVGDPELARAELDFLKSLLPK